MDNATSTRPDNDKGPDRKDNEKLVHIIYVPVELILGEMHLTGLGAGPIGTVTLAQVARHIGQPAPTDVVVFNKEPWHFAGPPGKKELRSHPQVHRDYPETILLIKPNEQAVWWSEKQFEITDIAPSADPAHPMPLFPEGSNTPPQYPFTGPSPMLTRLEPHAQGNFWVARSGVPKVEARKHMYKIAFTIEGDAIDPDGYCTGN